MKKTKHTTVDLVLASTFAHTCRDRKKVSKIAISVERVERLSKQRKILKIDVIEVCKLRYMDRVQFERLLLKPSYSDWS